MRDVRDILEQGVRGFDPGDGFDKTRRRVRRRQTTRRLVAAGTSLAVAAAGGVFAWRTFTDRAVVPPRPATQPVFAGTIPLPGTPADVAVSENAIWAVTVDGTVLRIDPSTEHLLEIATITGPGRLAVGFGGLWVLDPEHAQVLRIELATGKVQATIQLPDPGPDKITITPEAVLVAGRGRLVSSIDPSTHVVDSHRDELPGPGPRTFYERAGDVLWTAGPFWLAGESPSTGLKRGESGLSLTTFSASPQALWFADLRWNIRSFTLSERFRDHPVILRTDPISAIAATEDVLWVVTAPEGDGALMITGYSTMSGKVLGSARAAERPDRFNTEWAVEVALSPTDVWVTDPLGKALLRFSLGGKLAPPVEISSAPLSGDSCDPASLEPSYVPDGFSAESSPGPGGGVPADAWPGDAVHYQGSDLGTHITVTIIEEPDGIPQGHGDAQPIRMLGASGTIGSIEDGYSVEWVNTFPPTGEPCAAGLWIAAYGVSKAHLRGFAEGLTQRDSRSMSDMCPPPSLRPTYLPPGFSATPHPGPGPWDPQLQVGDAKPPTTAIHFRGHRGEFIAIARYPEGSFYFFHEEIHRSIRVLRTRAELGSSNFGSLVTFQHGDHTCNRYSIIFPGDGRAEHQLGRFAEGLRET